MRLLKNVKHVYRNSCKITNLGITVSPDPSLLWRGSNVKLHQLCLVSCLTTSPNSLQLRRQSAFRTHTHTHTHTHTQTVVRTQWHTHMYTHTRHTPSHSCGRTLMWIMWIMWILITQLLTGRAIMLAPMLAASLIIFPALCKLLSLSNT